MTKYKAEGLSCVAVLVLPYIWHIDSRNSKFRLTVFESGILKTSKAILSSCELWHARMRKLYSQIKRNFCHFWLPYWSRTVPELLIPNAKTVKYKRGHSLSPAVFLNLLNVYCMFLYCYYGLTRSPCNAIPDASATFGEWIAQISCIWKAHHIGNIGLHIILKQKLISNKAYNWKKIRIYSQIPASIYNLPRYFLAQ